MLVDNIILQLLRMLLDERTRHVGMGECILYASAQQTLEAADRLLPQRAAHDDTAQRQGQRGAALPFESEVGDEFEVAARIYESALMYQYARIEVAPFDRRCDLREEQRHTLPDLGEQTRHQSVGRSMQSGHGDTPQRCPFTPPPHQKRAVAAAESRTAIQKTVLGRYLRQQRTAHLAYVGCARLQRAVQLLDVVIRHVEGKTVKVDAAVDDGIEHEGVVRAGRYGQFESLHGFTFVRFSI